MTTWSDLGIDLRGRTGQIKTHCPKCHHRRKPEHRNERELSVNTETGWYFCHNPGCEWNVKGLNLNPFTGSPIAARWARPAPMPKAGLTNAGRRFLNDRSIDFTVAENLGVWDDGKAIAFPYLRDGETIHVKYRSLTEKKWWSSKDTEPVFYNLDAVQDASDIIIVEGELDVLALATAGIPCAISVPNGAPDAGQDAGKKLACMETTGDLFAAASRVIIATDNDAPGRELAKHLVRRIGPEKCWRVDWPTGTKDANECLENYGAEVLVRLVENARPEPYKGLIYGHTLADDIWDSRNDPFERGVSTGIPSLDRYYRPDVGHSTLWGGTPSSGKSAFLSFVSHNIAHAHDWKYAVFTPETYPHAEFYRELVQIHVGKALRKMDEGEYREAIQWVSDHFILESPHEPMIDDILEHARVCVQRHGISGVIIDPYTNVMPPPGAGHLGTNEVIGRFMTKINQFKQEYRCHMNVAVHPTKPLKNKDGSIDPIGPYDLGGGSNWFNMSDEIVMIHRTDRNRDDAAVEIRVWKMRSRYHGKVGATQVQFVPETGRYKDLGPPF